jgi:hypothetical protein
VGTQLVEALVLLGGDGVEGRADDATEVDVRGVPDGLQRLNIGQALRFPLSGGMISSRVAAGQGRA